MNLKTTTVGGPWELHDTRIWWNLDLGGLWFHLLIQKFYTSIILKKEGRRKVKTQVTKN